MRSSFRMSELHAGRASPAMAMRSLKHILAFDPDAVRAHVCPGCSSQPSVEASVFLAATLEATMERVLQRAIDVARDEASREQLLRAGDAERSPSASRFDSRRGVRGGVGAGSGIGRGRRGGGSSGITRLTSRWLQLGIQRDAQLRALLAHGPAVVPLCDVLVHFLDSGTLAELEESGEWSTGMIAAAARRRERQNMLPPVEGATTLEQESQQHWNELAAQHADNAQQWQRGAADTHAVTPVCLSTLLRKVHPGYSLPNDALVLLMAVCRALLNVLRASGSGAGKRSSDGNSGGGRGRGRGRGRDRDRGQGRGRSYCRRSDRDCAPRAAAAARLGGAR